MNDNEPQCRHRSASGTICGLPKGHHSPVHERSYNGGKSQWTDHEERATQ